MRRGLERLRVCNLNPLLTRSMNVHYNARLTAVFEMIEPVVKLAAMKACVEEVRARMVRAVVEKGMARAAAELFGVSVPGVGRFARTLSGAGGSPTPRVSTGRPRKRRLPEHVQALREHLASEPDLEAGHAAFAPRRGLGSSGRKRIEPSVGPARELRLRKGRVATARFR